LHHRARVRRSGDRGQPGGPVGVVPPAPDLGIDQVSSTRRLRPYSRPSPSPSQRRPAAASGGAAGWEACHREDLAASPVRRHPKSRYESRTSWLGLGRSGHPGRKYAPCQHTYSSQRAWKSGSDVKCGCLEDFLWAAYFVYLWFSAPLCQAALRECACESAMMLLKTASQTRLLRHRSASLRDLPSAIFLR
jgi:hypothetical protein